MPDCKALFGLLAAAMLVSACGGGNSTLTTQSIPSLGQPSTEGPVNLTRPDKPQAANLPSALKPLNMAKATRAVDRYLVNNAGKPATHKIAGADLDGDGKAEALVYLEGEKWCAVTGCSLLVMRDNPTGFEAISLVKRVKLPISIAPKATSGWRDILVKSGQLGATKLVSLQFNGSGYPGNANSQPQTVAGLNALPEIAIRPSRTASNTVAPGSNLIPGQN